MIRKRIRQRQIESERRRFDRTRRLVICTAQLAHRPQPDHVIEFIAQKIRGDLPKQLSRLLGSSRYTKAMVPVMLMARRYLDLIDPQRTG